MNIFVARAEGDDPTGQYPHATRNHYALGAVGLGIAALCVFLAYSVLLGVAELFPLLSTTVLTFVGVITWVVVWIALDVTYDRYVRWKRASAK